MSIYLQEVEDESKGEEENQAHTERNQVKEAMKKMNVLYDEVSIN